MLVCLWVCLGECVDTSCVTLDGRTTSMSTEYVCANIRLFTRRLFELLGVMQAGGDTDLCVLMVFI